MTDIPSQPEIPFFMKALYIERRRNEVIECAKAYESKDFGFLEKIGHQVKSNAVTFGFAELAPLAETLELAAIQKDAQLVQLTLAELRAAVERLTS